jgi:hypothetical protein
MFNVQSQFPQALLKIAAITVATVSAAGTAAADDSSDRSVLATQANTGFYVAAGPGRSSSQVDVGSAARVAPYVISGNPLGLQITGGYRPLPAWSAEAGYVRLGRISSGHSDATTDGLMLSALGYLPTPVLTLYGRAGVLHARTYGAYAGPAALQPVPIHHNNTNLAFGVGLSTNFNSHFNLRLESQGFQITHAKNTSLFTIAFVWSFL